MRRGGATFTVEEIRAMGRDHPTDGAHLTMANIVRIQAWLTVAAVSLPLIGLTTYLRDEVGPGLEPLLAASRVAVTGLFVFALGNVLINGLRYGPAMHYQAAIDAQFAAGRRGAWIRLHSPSNWDTLFAVLFTLFLAPALLA
ncbi:hypothetical protein Asi02nite_53440 [Asanoa siamensis]|uniref:Uncharacterized protein n=2 Tax=Asanoa siamensis TaxID=926357 RepID=A0ABQ4CX02_9ACTN|nr:hypothetical protein Asi02nite_53440 [Asanoa siamensis]